MGTFFVGTNASDIAVDANLAKDARLLSAGAPGAGPLDGENARVMANLARSLRGPDVQYRQLIDILGVDAQRAERQANIQIGITNAVDAAAQSVSGVNLDEEMTNLVRDQRSYNAAAVYLRVMDEALDALLGIIR